jgi:light-regulated signal transduction histidine kinase (bacteriophytochrome)
MESLIESLLTYSRIGRTELGVQKTDLNEIVKNVVEEVRLIDREGVIEIQIVDPLPTLECDRVRIGEVFQNLITNAIKYNDAPAKTIEIGYNGQQEAAGGRKAHMFFVRDNGIGIPEKHRSNVFSMFRRLHGRDKYGGGTGAGLSIAKKIVERHGGQIWVESSTGAGSTFYFTLVAR